MFLKVVNMRPPTKIWFPHVRAVSSEAAKIRGTKVMSQSHETSQEFGCFEGIIGYLSIVSLLRQNLSGE
jgi:hypothetical protein